MMKFVCWARVSQALLLTMHTTGLTNKMHLFRAYISLVCFATHRKVTGGVHEEFTAWEAQARDLKSGPNTRVIFCSPRHSYGRWEDYTDMEATQELNQIPCLKPDSLPPYSSGRFSCGSTHNCSQSVLPCLFPEATCTCSTRPGNTIGILADLSHSLVACMKQNKQKKSFGWAQKSIERLLDGEDKSEYSLRSLSSEKILLFLNSLASLQQWSTFQEEGSFVCTSFHS